MSRYDKFNLIVTNLTKFDFDGDGTLCHSCLC